MFGQEKKKKVAIAEFDLEKSLMSDPSKEKALKEQIETRVQDLKTTMRQGIDKPSFEDAQILLNAYLAAQKVATRAKRRHV